MTSASVRAHSETSSPAPRGAIILGPGALQPAAAIFDAIVLMLGGVTAIVAYGGNWADIDRGLDDNIGGVLTATALFVALSWSSGVYGNAPGQSWHRSAFRALKSWGATLCCLALFAFLLKVGAQYSRGSALLYAAFGGLSVSLAHGLRPWLVRCALEHGTLFSTPVLLIEMRKDMCAADRNTDPIPKLRAAGLRPVMTIEWDSSDPAMADPDRIALIEECVRTGGINEIVLVPDHDTLNLIDQMTAALRVFPLPVRCVFPPKIQSLFDRRLRHSGGVVLADYQSAPLSLGDRCAKRLLDVIVASLGLIVLSPLLAVTALTVRFGSKGPVIFRQWRRGFGGRPFKIYKFRSMTVAEDGATVTQVSKDDIRVTRFGRFIRRSSIDELPQLLNVLIGNMSIVGPRPHALAHDDHYARLIEEYAFRHHAKPGLTGWAQVKGSRGETARVESMQARIEKDIWYIDNWSIWLDLQIIIRTVLVVFRQDQAY